MIKEGTAVVSIAMAMHCNGLGRYGGRQVGALREGGPRGLMPVLHFGSLCLAPEPGFQSVASFRLNPIVDGRAIWQVSLRPGRAMKERGIPSLKYVFLGFEYGISCDSRTE